MTCREDCLHYYVCSAGCPQFIKNVGGDAEKCGLFDDKRKFKKVEYGEWRDTYYYDEEFRCDFRGIECNKCGYIEKNNFDPDKNESPKYCPECGKNMLEKKWEFNE